jgi:hypothetical protein
MAEGPNLRLGMTPPRMRWPLLPMSLRERLEAAPGIALA